MKSNTKSHIISYIAKNGPIGPTRLAENLGISPQMVHRHLKKLVQKGNLKKIGLPPKVLYRLADETPLIVFEFLPEQLVSYVNQHYLTVKPNGEILEGTEGIQWWARRTKQHKNYRRLVQEYVDQHRQTNAKFGNSSDLIEATFKIEDTFTTCFLDMLYYQEFCSLPKFGKTKTGQMIFLGKSGQDKDTIIKLAELCRNSIITILKQHRIQAIIFTPHSIPRKIPFLKEFEKSLSMAVPTIQLLKVFSGKTPIAQKSLKKLSDRIENAESTLFLKEQVLVYKRILVIDDAVGSGATLNVIAKKLKTKGAKFVCGFAVTGSLKGFEVLNEI